MARSVATIQSYIQDAVVANFAAIGITINPTLWSKRNMLRTMCFTAAAGTALLEQLMDLFKQNIELTVSKSAAATALWVQDKMFKFQYSATNPQIIALINTVPTYPVVDPTLYLITACSVTSFLSNNVIVKVAKGNPLAALATLEISSAQGMINIVGIAGINYVVVSYNPDKLMLDAEVFYQGQYSAVIQTNVIAAVRLFLFNLSATNFNGALKMSELEATIKGVAGVNDVVLRNVRGRADTDLYSAGIDLILNTAIIQKQYLTIAGYIAEETTATKTFADTLTFTAQ